MKDDYNDLSEDEYIPRHASSDYNLNKELQYNSNNILDNLNFNDINNTNNIFDNLNFNDINNYNLNDNFQYNSNNTLNGLDYNNVNDYYIADKSINNNIYEDEFTFDNINEIKSNKKKKRTIKKWVWTVLISLFIVIIIFCLIKLLFWMRDNKNTSNVVNEINNITEVEEKEDNENTELVNEDSDKESDYWYYIKFPLINVDITKLKEKNADTVGWINVNNTNINYPYVQGKDNDYYLVHSFDKSYNEAGWVFLDYRNTSFLSDKNNIIYAHSRLDKTMFGSLSKTLKSNWYANKDNHIIRISTEEENTLWQIFSVYKIPEESYYITTNFNSDNEYEKFLNTIKERSLYNFNTNLTTNDKILTLSTCYSDTERTVVHAKLIKRSPR